MTTTPLHARIATRSILAAIAISLSMMLLTVVGCTQTRTDSAAVYQTAPNAATSKVQIEQQLRRVLQLQAELRYEEALQVVDEVLLVDPANPAGIALRETLITTIQYVKYSEMQRERDLKYPVLSEEAGRSMIVPSRNHTGPGMKSVQGVTEYPRDWPSLSQMRVSGHDGVPTMFGEEVWIIVQPNTPAAPPDPDLIDSSPGSGSLVAHCTEELKQRHTVTPFDYLGKSYVPVPLQHTDVNTSIQAYMASVNVTQQFTNPFDTKIEAEYVFPLPQNAAVNGFVMTVGDRRIRGIIRQRETAERIYSEARAQGYTASLLTQERPNIFKQSVANIEPGASVDIDITYFHTMTYDEGWYEYVFPMVVGPRFNPPGYRDGIGIAAQQPAIAAAQPTTVHYNRPNKRNGQDININLSIDATVPIEDLNIINHDVVVRRRTSERVLIELAKNDRIPNKDFVLRYKVAGDTVRSGLMTHVDGPYGYFSFMLVPPTTKTPEMRAPMEMVFVIDCSGSMSGEPLAQAKEAIIHALRQMQPNDTFQIIRFSSNASKFGNTPVVASRDNVRDAVNYVRSLNGTGGTMMIEGLRTALNFPHDNERLRVVAFLTDGHIGNETEILSEVAQSVGDARIFSFGVGSSPNRYLMNRMARLGRGVASYLSLNDSGAEVMDAYFSRISHPVLHDLAINWNGLPVTDVMPAAADFTAGGLPDLFVGRPLIVTGRFDAEALARLDNGHTRTITVRGRAAGQLIETEIPFDIRSADSHTALPAVWARNRIGHLMDLATLDNSIDVEGEVTAIALVYNLVSSWTSFVAVDASKITDGHYGVRVPVSVPVPDGERYDHYNPGQ